MFHLKYIPLISVMALKIPPCIKRSIYLHQLIKQMMQTQKHSLRSPDLPLAGGRDQGSESSSPDRDDTGVHVLLPEKSCLDNKAAINGQGGPLLNLIRFVWPPPHQSLLLCTWLWRLLLNLYTFSSSNLLRLKLSNFQRENTQLHYSLFLINQYSFGGKCFCLHIKPHMV